MVGNSSKFVIDIVKVLEEELTPSETVTVNEYEALVSKSGAVLNVITPAFDTLINAPSAPPMVKV